MTSRDYKFLPIVSLVLGVILVAFSLYATDFSASDQTLIILLLAGSLVLFFVAIVLLGRSILRVGTRTAVQKALFQSIVIDSDDAIVSNDLNGIITSWNPGAERIFGYSFSEVYGKHISIIVPDDHAREDQTHLRALVDGHRIEHFETVRRRKDGSTVPVSITLSPIRDPSGKILGASKIARDITYRLQVEEEKAKSEMTFRNTLDKLLEGIEIIGFDWRYRYVNEAYENQVKQSREELIGFTLMEKFPGIEQTEIFRAIQRCFHERVPVQLEDKFVFADQRVAWFEIIFRPVPEGVFILSVDVTAKKLAEEKTRQSEDRFRTLIENTHTMVSIVDKDFKNVYRSPASTRITGWTNEESDTRERFADIHPEDSDLLKVTLAAILKRPGATEPIRFRTRHKDGHYVFLEGTISNMLQNESIGGIVSNFRDVTETRKIEEQLRQSARIYQTIASSIPGSLICILDPEYRYLLAEGDMLEKMGYHRTALVGQKAADIIPPERLKEVLPNFERVFRGESFSVEDYRPGFDVISRFVPLKDEADRVFAAMVVLFDVSELKSTQRELATLNTGLEQRISERTAELNAVNKELEAFSYSVAHDLRSPLRAILGYSTVLKEEHSAGWDDEVKRLIGRIQINAKKMGNQIDDLLTFSRLGRREIQKSIVDMEKISEAAIVDLHLEEDYPGTITVHKLPEVMADPLLMKFVMTNLLSNAVKYSSKKEHPVIDVSSEVSEGKVVFTVTDNGVGFPMEYAHRLFGVFQRLHSETDFSGTGVGLAIVHRIIQRHGGEVGSHGVVGEGARFHFSIPTAAKVIP